MSDYIDYNFCPDCGLPRGVCTCGDEGHYDDDYDPADDPNRCPECGADITCDGAWCFCTDTNECGWSEYVGDDDEEGGAA